MAPHWFGCYRLWVQENIDKLNLVESIVSKCVWLLPNRFSESEFGAESCRAVLGLIQLWHESLFNCGDQDSRFTWSIALEAIQKVEVLYEMRAIHLELIGKCNKYTSLAALELIKLLVRLFLLNSSRTLLETTIPTEDSIKDRRNAYHVVKAFKYLSRCPSTPVNEAWYSASERWDSTPSSSSSSVAAEEATSKQQNDVHYCRNVDSAMDCEEILNENFWWNQPSHMEPIIDPTQQSNNHSDPHVDSSDFCFRMGRLMVLLGEILHLIRPFVSCLFYKKFGSCSWKPWLISLGMDLLSQTFLTKGAELMKYAGIYKTDDLTVQDQLLAYLTMMRNFQWTPIEEQEMKRRKKMFLMYLMRSPLFELLTKPGLNMIERRIAIVPVLGKVISKALELLYGAQRYYVYTDGQY